MITSLWGWGYKALKKDRLTDLKLNLVSSLFIAPSLKIPNPLGRNGRFLNQPLE